MTTRPAPHNNFWQATNLWQPLAVVCALAVAYWTTLAKLGADWWNDPNYSHGLLIPFIGAYILWSERERIAAAPVRPRFWTGLGLIVCALVGLWAGTVGAEMFVQRASLVLMLGGLVVCFFGFHILRFALVPLVLLALAIPIPAIIFNQIAFPLQLFASRCAVWTMRAAEIPVLRDGNVIELMPKGSVQTRKLEVVEACSGIRSLMTLVTLSVVYAYFTHPKADDGGASGASGADVDGRTNSTHSWGGKLFDALRSYGFWRAIIIVGAAVPIAIITNAARVSGTGILARHYGMEIADGFFHSFSGWIVYVIAFLMLFALGSMLDKAYKILRGKTRGGGRSVASAQKTVHATKTAATTSARVHVD